ncbi:26922_t:CDS:2, partial [Racocetra persica]
LEKYLALDCPNQNKNIIDFYTQIIANQQGRSQAASQEITSGVELSKKKHKLAGDQASLSEFLESTKLTPQHKNNINSALIKVFIVCNIPFYVISNPYFIDTLRALRELWPEYQPLSRQLLADRLLNAEIIKLNQNIRNILEKANNLTLGLDRWTDSSGKSLWNFSHTGETLQEYIQKIFDELGAYKFEAIVTD